MAVTTNNHPTQAALRMAKATEVCRWHECSRRTLYFSVEGRYLRPGGRKANGVGSYETWVPPNFAVAVEYPFCPSVASCEDLLADHERTGESVRYDEERWEADPRVDEQAGPSLVEDWMLIELVEKRAVAA